jgi:hypothetical protein
MSTFKKGDAIVSTRVLTYADKTIPAGTRGIVDDAFELAGDFFYTVRFIIDMFDRLADEDSLAPG